MSGLGRLRAALGFFALTHVVGLGTMALVLRPGMDSAAFSLAERAAFVASHGAAWRLGWLPWQLSALSDLWVTAEMLRLALRRGASDMRRYAVVALLLFFVAAIPEQWAEAKLVTSFIAGAAGDLQEWAREWALYAALTGVWANCIYTAMTGCWMLWARKLLGRSVVHPALELSMLGAFVVSGALTLVATHAVEPANVGAWFQAASAFNGLAFPALVLWSLRLIQLSASSRQIAAE